MHSIVVIVKEMRSGGQPLELEVAVVRERNCSYRIHLSWRTSREPGENDVQTSEWYYYTNDIVVMLA